MLKTYWNNGKLQSIAFFYGKRREGHWKGYFDDSKISYEADFHNNLDTGNRKLYFENGRVRVLEKYEDGKQVETWRYDSSGNLLKHDSF